MLEWSTRVPAEDLPGTLNRVAKATNGHDFATRLFGRSAALPLAVVTAAGTQIFPLILWPHLQMEAKHAAAAAKLRAEATKLREALAEAQADAAAKGEEVSVAVCRLDCAPRAPPLMHRLLCVA